MKTASIVVCLLLISAGCIVQTDNTGHETTVPGASLSERIDERAKPPEEPTTPSPVKYDTDIDRIENLVHQKMNDRRKTHGVDQLKRSKKLDSIARYKSWDMAQRDYFSHRGPQGTSHLEMRREYNSSCENLGQNIYKRTFGGEYQDKRKQLRQQEQIATQAVNSLMNSTGHRQNILDPDYEVQGIGVFVDENGTVYLTQEFCG